MSAVMGQSALDVGTVLQSYEILSVLGVGGFGVTYLATHTRIDLKVAIKEYLPRDHAHRTDDSRVVANAGELSADAEVFRYGLDRFVDEARSLVRFQHPHIVRAQDYFEANGTAYIVMEYAEGETLEKWLRRQPRGPVPEETLRGIFLPLLDGLSEVHAQDLLHRDIKPANIYLRRDGTPLLIDFGAARSELGAGGRSHHVQITPGYSPKEQYASAGRQGPWTDIYSVGASLLRCIGGREPASALDRAEAFDNGEPDPLPLATEIGRGLYSASFLNSIDHCLAWDPPRRLQNVRALQDGLLGVRDPGPRGPDGKFGPATGAVRLEAGEGSLGRIDSRGSEPDGATRLLSDAGAAVGIDRLAPTRHATPSALARDDAARRADRFDVAPAPSARDAFRADDEREPRRAPRAAVGIRPVVGAARAGGRGRTIGRRWVPFALVPLVLAGLFLVLWATDLLPGRAIDEPLARDGTPPSERRGDAGGVPSDDYAVRRARFRDNAAELRRVRAVVPDDEARALREAEALAERQAGEGRFDEAIATADALVDAQRELLETSPREADVGSTPEEIRDAFEDCEAHYGRDGCAPSWFEIERRRVVRLSPFALDPTEVSFAEFAAFMDATDYTPTSVERGWSLRQRPDLSIEKLEGFTVRQPTGPGSELARVAERPVVHVSWFDANAFCRHRGARLPSRAEWEVGTGAADGARYASYFDPGASRAGGVGTDRLVTLATDAAELRDPASGLHGATGNVWEWTSTIDPSHPGGTRRFAKGGSAREMALVNMRLTALRPEYPGDSYIDLGFRCARPLERWP